MSIDNNNFTRGNLGWVRNGYRFTFGREKAHIGPETFSSLLVSDRIPYLNCPADLRPHRALPDGLVRVHDPAAGGREHLPGS